MSFDVATFLKDYIEDVKTAFPEYVETIDANYNLETLDTAAECKFFEDALRPHFMKILQKDDSLFETPVYILRGVNVSTSWASLEPDVKETLWKYIRLSIAFSFLGGDSSQQIQSILGMIKQVWTQQTGREESEVDALLNDERTQSSIQDLLESFSNSKIAKLVTEMIETITPEQLGLENFDFTNITELAEIFKNMEHPIVRRATTVITTFLDEKMRSGFITKEELVAEVEGFKSHITGSLRKLVQEALIGETNGGGPRQDGATLMSNHPDARRARMLARLQRKQREKTSVKK